MRAVLSPSKFGLNLSLKYGLRTRLARLLRQCPVSAIYCSSSACSADRAGIRETVAQTQPIAMVHHGGVTDRLFAEGKADLVHDYVKAAKDAGVLAGILRP